MRSQKAHASRGSRPLRMTSMPRHMVPDEMASPMAPWALRIASTRRWPSMRVTGSTTIRVAMVFLFLFRRLQIAGFLAEHGGGGVRGHARGGQRDEGLADRVRRRF